jgi:hypothetical protein
MTACQHSIGQLSDFYLWVHYIGYVSDFIFKNKYPRRLGLSLDFTDKLIQFSIVNLAESIALKS